MRRLLGPLLVLLAGCIDAGPPLPDYSTVEHFGREIELTYAPAVRTDADGQPLPMDGWAYPIPRFVQRMVDGEGSNPGLAINSDDSVALSAFDRARHAPAAWENWTVTHTHVSPGFPAAEDRAYSIETALTRDPVTGRLYLIQYNLGTPDPTGLTDFRTGRCPTLHLSDDGGRTWRVGGWVGTDKGSTSEPTSCFATENAYGIIAHPKIAVGPRPAAGPWLRDLGAPGTQPRVLYLCATYWTENPARPSHAPVVTCSLSEDDGATWTRRGPVGDSGLAERISPLPPACQIINVGQPVVSSDGRLLVPVARGIVDRGVRPCGPGLAISGDGGRSWTLSVPPPSYGVMVEREPVVVLSPDERIAYLGYVRADTGAVVLGRTRDGFTQWDPPFRVSPVNHTHDAAVTLTVGPQGRLAIGYYSAFATDPRRTSEVLWHGFVSMSFDAQDERPTFLTVPVTPRQDPLLSTCGFAVLAERAGPEDHLGCAALGNRIGIAFDSVGRVVFAFTDGCDIRNKCIGDFSSAHIWRDRQISVAVQVEGAGLDADVALLPALALQPPRPPRMEP